MHEQDEEYLMFTRLERIIPGIEEVFDLSGEIVFTVLVDESPQLTDLKEQARTLKGTPFRESADTLVGLTLSVLGKNAVELAATDPEARDFVFAEHTLGEALASGKACCRYQALLFFILAREAQLGVSHSLLTQDMVTAYSAYNLIFDESGRAHVFSLYNMSLSSDVARKRYGYPKPDGNPIPGYDFNEMRDYYAYVRDREFANNPPLVIKTKGNSRAIGHWNRNLARLL